MTITQLPPILRDPLWLRSDRSAELPAVEVATIANSEAVGWPAPLLARRRARCAETRTLTVDELSDRLVQGPGLVDALQCEPGVPMRADLLASAQVLHGVRLFRQDDYGRTSVEFCQLHAVDASETMLELEALTALD